MADCPRRLRLAHEFACRTQCASVLAYAHDADRPLAPMADSRCRTPSSCRRGDEHWSEFWRCDPGTTIVGSKARLAVPAAQAAVRVGTTVTSFCTGAKSVCLRAERWRHAGRPNRTNDRCGMCVSPPAAFSCTSCGRERDSFRGFRPPSRARLLCCASLGLPACSSGSVLVCHLQALIFFSAFRLARLCLR